MNKMSIERRAAVLSSLVEGNSIASTCRMFVVNKVTVLRLLADAGTLAHDYHDLVVRDLATKRIQMDEIWSFCHSKNQNVRSSDWGKGYGDLWTWVSIDADSKLVINWHVGGRDGGAATIFVADLADRLNDRVQLTSDGWAPYRNAVTRAFGSDVDYAMLIKTYGPDRSTATRYSPPQLTSVTTEVRCGTPAEAHISTSFVERQNLSMRMGMRRFTRLTNGFSKRAENHKHMIALYYFHYNFIRPHMTIKTTPALLAGVADHEWTMVEFVEKLAWKETTCGGRLTNYKASKRRAS
jgi:IS1 family transposase